MSSISNNMTDIKNSLASLQVTNNNRAFFKGTFAIIIVYTVFVVGLVAAGSTKFGAVFSTTFYPFSVTFILGTLLVVIIMIYSLLTAQKVSPLEPAPMSEASYACPDYYKLVYDPEGASNMKITCVPTSVLPLRSSMPLQADEESAGITPTADGVIVGPSTSNLYSYLSSNSSEANLTTCSTIYPQLIRGYELTTSNMDTKTVNVFTDTRCQFAEACGTNWSTLNCGFNTSNVV